MGLILNDNFLSIQRWHTSENYAGGTLEPRFYVAPGSLPVSIEIVILNSKVAWYPAMQCSLDPSRLFDDEIDALDLARREKRTALDRCEFEYEMIMSRIDAVELEGQ